jgi:hypothetical protein
MDIEQHSTHVYMIAQLAVRTRIGELFTLEGKLGN